MSFSQAPSSAQTGSCHVRKTASLRSLADAAALCGNKLRNGVTRPQQPQVVLRQTALNYSSRLAINSLSGTSNVHWQLQSKRKWAACRHRSCTNRSKSVKLVLQNVWFLSAGTHVVQPVPPGMAISIHTCCSHTITMCSTINLLILLVLLPLDYGMVWQGSILGRSQKCASPKHPDRHWRPLAVKRSGRHVYQLPQSIEEVKNQWSGASVRPINKLNTLVLRNEINSICS
jgi:hypothetical protein